MSLAPLVQTADLAGKYGAKDAEFYVAAATAEVRRYCGWHIAPSVDVVGGKYPCGERGLIMLLSLHVTGVDSVTVDGRQLDPGEYSWEECGVVTRLRPSWPRDPYALVDFTHGHAECPPDVASIVFEVATKAMALPAIPAGKFEAVGGPFRLSLADAVLGSALSPDHKDRLTNYRLQGIG